MPFNYKEHISKSRIVIKTALQKTAAFLKELYGKTKKFYTEKLHPKLVSENSPLVKLNSKIKFKFLVPYTLAVILTTFLLLRFTPLNDWVNYTSAEQQEKYDLLNSKIETLLNDLNKLTILNAKLTIVDSISRDTTRRYRDSLYKSDTLFIDTTGIHKKIKKIEVQKIDTVTVAPITQNMFGFLEVLVNYLFSPIEFTKPVQGSLSRGFEPDQGHFGVDFAAQSNKPIFAANSGYVIFSGYTAKDGNMIIIHHNEGYLTFYKHCSTLFAKEKETVVHGETIALIGSSGEGSTGPHLHFEIWKDGRPVDPLQYIKK